MRLFAKMAAAVAIFTLGVLAALHAQSSQPSIPQWQIDAGGKMAFEVASIKPTSSGHKRPGMETPPGRFVARYATVKMLLAFAFNRSKGGFELNDDRERTGLGLLGEVRH